MRRPNTFLRVAAVASSVLLVGGLLCYRAGAFGWSAAPTQPTAEANPAPAEAGPAEPPVQVHPVTLMPGSKTIAISPVVPAPTSAPPVVMGGSKSTFTPVIGATAIPPLANTPNQPQAPAANPPK